MKLEDEQKQTEIEENPFKHHHHPKFYYKHDQPLKHVARTAAECPYLQSKPAWAASWASCSSLLN